MEDKYISKRKFICSLAGLGSILTISTPTQAGIFKGSLIDRLFVSGPKEKKAEKKLNEYAADGKITDYEKEQILKISGDKKVINKVSSTQNRLEAERREREKKEEAERKARYKVLAEQEYKAAYDAHNHKDYSSAMQHMNKAVGYSPYNIKYRLYRDQIKTDERTDRQIRAAGRWIGGKIDKLKK